MSVTNRWIISVAVVSLCVGRSGCRPASFPVPGAFRRAPATGRPAVVPDLPGPRLQTPVPLQIPRTTLNPWKPKVPERDWKYIVLHHTGTSQGSVAAIDAAHRKRKDKRGHHWLGIGYDFVIGNGQGMGDGEIEATFRWRKQIQGAHAGVRKYNEYGIGIALVGNFDKTWPTPAQMRAVKRLVGTLKAAYGIGSDHVFGHNQVRATACPGHNFPLAEVSNSGSMPEFVDRRPLGRPVPLVGLQRRFRQ